jgi:hypothetical protein
MTLTNVLTGEKKKILADKDGLARFTINNSANFRLYRYLMYRENY